MIDLGKMESSVNQLMRMYPDNTRATQSIGEVNELIAKLRQAEKDAARYRWLRDSVCFEGSADDLFHATPAETDAEFDRFMQCER